MTIDHETKIELMGKDYPALVEYEFDEGQGADSILILSVTLRRCVKQRGDLDYDHHGDAYLVRTPIFISLDITQFLNGKQIKALAEEVYADIKENNWDEVMNEPRQHVPSNFPPNFPGVRL